MKNYLKNQDNNSGLITVKDVDSMLPEIYKETAGEIKDIYEKAIKVDPSQKEYSEKTLDMQAVLEGVKGNSNLSITGSVDKTVSNKEFKLSDMVKDVVDLINKSFNVSIPDSTIKEIKEAISEGYNKGTTTYAFDLLFAPKEEKKFLSGLFINVQFSITEKKKKVLGFIVKKEKVYTSNIKGLMVGTFKNK